MTRKLMIAGAVALAPVAALAHHPLAGAPMESFADGLLSGFGHPVLGFDHLFFVVAVGLAAALAGRALLLPLGYVAAMLAGCLAVGLGADLPLREEIVALSLLAVGGVVLAGRRVGGGAALLLFAGFGLFHGAAFGQAIAGQEAGAGAPVLLGYLLGLGALQYAVAAAVGLAAGRLGGVHARLAGAAVAGMGLFLTLEAVEGAVFAAAGWAA